MSEEVRWATFTHASSRKQTGEVFTIVVSRNPLVNLRHVIEYFKYFGMAAQFVAHALKASAKCGNKI